MNLLESIYLQSGPVLELSIVISVLEKQIQASLYETRQPPQPPLTPRAAYPLVIPALTALSFIIRPLQPPNSQQTHQNGKHTLHSPLLSPSFLKTRTNNIQVQPKPSPHQLRPRPLHPYLPRRRNRLRPHRLNPLNRRRSLCWCPVPPVLCAPALWRDFRRGTRSSGLGYSRRKLHSPRH